jgi:indolepyruvate ferredoxin oxidoreductase beta subunit
MMKGNYSFSLVLGGLSGQGLIMYTRVLATATLDTDYTVRTYDVLGTAHRGTLCFTHIRISDRWTIGPIIGAGAADMLIGFEPLEGLRVGAYYLKNNGMAIINTRKIIPIYAAIGKDFTSNVPRPKGYPPLEEIFGFFKDIGCDVVSFNAVEIAEKLGHYTMMNMVLLGASLATNKIPVSVESVEKVIKKLAPVGTADRNINALRKGMEVYKELAGS